jgi:hypothetical protein
MGASTLIQILFKQITRFLLQSNVLVNFELRFYIIQVVIKLRLEIV